MEFELKGDTVHLSGSLDGPNDLEGMKLASGPVRFDVSGLTKVSSFGLKAFIHFIERYQCVPIYLNCSAFFAMHLSMCRELRPFGSRVESVIFGASCRECNHSTSLLLEHGIDFEVGKPFELATLPLCVCGKGHLEPDLDLTSVMDFTNYSPRKR